MDDYPSNRHRDAEPKTGGQTKQETKQETKRVEKVVTTPGIKRKKSMWKRFTETFPVGDNQTVRDYIVFDIIVPGAKNMIADSVTQGIEQKLFGEVRSSSRRTGARPDRGSYTNYNGMSSNRALVGAASRREDPRERDRNPSRRARATHDFGDIVLATRAEANEVLENLFSLVERYDSASVGDLYEMVDIEGDFTDQKWGWTDMRGSEIVRVTDGYLLELPRPIVLD